MKQNLKRARQLLLFLTFGIASMLTENVTAQSCAAPLPLTINDCDNLSVNDSIVWLSFNSGSGASWCNINISVPLSNPSSILGAELYSGTCNSLTLVQSGFQDIGDVVIRSTISASTTYLVKVTRSNANNGQLNICASVVASVDPCAPCTTDGCQLVCNPDLEIAMWPDPGLHFDNFVSLNVCNWDTPGATPDYFTSPSITPNTNLQTPGNFFGTESPHSGSAYAGIYCYYSFDVNYREYIQHQLQQPLIAGEWYSLTFWVSLSDYSGYAINHLGAYFSANQPLQPANPTFPNGNLLMNITPQIVCTTAVTAVSGWVPITGTFQATAGMQWITIGSFENDLVQQHPSVTPSVIFPDPHPPGNPNKGSYYYIDDITLLRKPDPCFTWNSVCDIVNFTNNTTGCSQLILSESWDFGDPASGPNNISTSSNPSHTFTQDQISYTVTHTIQTPYGSFTCTDQVIQEGRPVANISGLQVNNCGNGFLTYTANPCDPGIVYTWTVYNNPTTSTYTGCSININWGNLGGYVTLTAWDPSTDCSSSSTLIIPECCAWEAQSGVIRIDNMLASQAIAQYGNPITSSNDIYITGVFTVDVPITFLNCDLINIGTNTPINILPNQTLTFDDCTTSTKCTYMWDGIYIPDPNTTLNIINGSVIRYAKHAVVSNNGGNFFIENSTLQNNDTDIVVNTYTGVHTGIVRGTTFNMNGAMLPALPALPANHTKTVCAIEIKNNANITIGDASQAAYQNKFDNILVGIRTRNSVTTVVNGLFSNMNPTPPQFTILNAGTGIVAIGAKNYLYQPTITVGGVGLNACTFTNMITGIAVFERHNVYANWNIITKVHGFGILVQRCQQSTITLNNNFINNAAASYPFNTGILLLECYNANANISFNRIWAPMAVPNQTGVGIRVGLVTPGDMILNVFGNTINRVKTGILAEQLIGKNHVLITNNTISFQKPNAQYTTTHSGIHLMRCATVSVRYNTITKTGANPTNALLTTLNGIYLESSSASLVSHNTMRKMGSGVFGWETCTSSILACNTLDNCFYGFRFDGIPDMADPNGGCDIGDQIPDISNNNNPVPTGNTWIPLGVIGSYDIGGDIYPGITWYCDPTYCPTDNLSPGSFNTPPVSLNSSTTGCTIVQYQFPPVKEREINVGQTVQNPVPYVNEKQFSNERDAHRKLRNSPTWMSLGTPQDSLFTSFYTVHDNTNIGLFRNFEDMAAVDSVQAAGNILSTITGTNTSENNLHVVYSIYQQTWMQGLFEFSSSDSATLYSIATQTAADAGEAVYAARVMLDLQVDENGGNNQRFAEPNEEGAPETTQLYPNPADDAVTGSVVLNETQSAIINIVDLQGKIVLSQAVTTSGAFSLDVSELDAGMYFVQIAIDGELKETSKLEVIHE